MSADTQTNPVRMVSVGTIVNNGLKTIRSGLIIMPDEVLDFCNIADNLFVSILKPYVFSIGIIEHAGVETYKLQLRKFKRVKISRYVLNSSGFDIGDKILISRFGNNEEMIITKPYLDEISAAAEAVV